MDKIVINKRLYNFPLNTLLTFLVFTEVLFFIGPLDYIVPSNFQLFFFFITVNIAFYLGYKKGIASYRIKDSHTFSLKFVQICIIVSLFLLPLRIDALWGINGFSPIAVYSHLRSSLVNPALVYSSKLELVSGVTTYLTIVLSPIIYLSISLCITEFKKLKGIWKFCAIIIIVSEVLLPIGQGVRKGVLDIILTLVFLSIAKNPLLLSFKRYWRYYLFLVLVIFLFLFYFIYSNMSRYGVNDMSVLLNEGSAFSNIKDEYRDLNPLVLVPISSIESYLCQGYIALGYALDSDFTFTFGVGSSWFGLNLMNRLGVEVLPYTYVGQLEKIGIDPMINWHSIYTWLATDLTFWGVPLFIYLMGYYLSTSWLDTIYKRNIYSAGILVLFIIMTFYSFANNQVFSLSFIAFIVLFSLWKINR